jgi:hypothetical protein
VAGAALAQIAPVRRGDLELFEPELRDLADDPELFDAYADAKCARQAGARTSYTALPSASGCDYRSSPMRDRPATGAPRLGPSLWVTYYRRGAPRFHPVSVEP